MTAGQEGNLLGACEEILQANWTVLVQAPLHTLMVVPQRNTNAAATLIAVIKIIPAPDPGSFTNIIQ